MIKKDVCEVYNIRYRREWKDQRMKSSVKMIRKAKVENERKIAQDDKDK